MGKNKVLIIFTQNLINIFFFVGKTKKENFVNYLKYFFICKQKFHIVNKVQLVITLQQFSRDTFFFPIFFFINIGRFINIMKTGNSPADPVMVIIYLQQLTLKQIENKN